MMHLRGTGRTTRMLQHAAALAAKGQDVVVVAATYSHAAVLQGQFNTLFPDFPATRKEKTALGPLTFQNGEVSFKHYQVLERELGVPLHEFRYLSPFKAVLIDHFTLEHKYSWVLGEMHRWDLPDEGEGRE